MGRRVELTYRAEYEPSMEHMVRALQIVLDAPVGERQGTTAANDIADGGCAANAGRGQATAAPHEDSLARPAVE